MGRNAGEAGTLRRLVGQWAARIALCLAAIVGALLMLVSNILDTSGGGRPHETQAWRMPRVPARLSWPMESEPQAVVAARGLLVHDRRAKTMLAFMTVGILSIVQFGSGASRYSTDRHAAT